MRIAFKSAQNFYPAWLSSLAVILVLNGTSAYAENPRPEVECKVNGKAAHLCFDTGASDTLIFRQSAARLGLKVIPRPKDAPAPASGKVKVDSTEPSTLTAFGKSTTLAFTILEVDQTLYRHLGVDGLFSWNDVSADALLLDGEKRICKPIPLSPDLATWTRWKMVPGVDLLMLERTDGNKTTRIGIDTGNPYGVMLSDKNWEKWLAAHSRQPATIFSSWFPATGFYLHQVFRAETFDLGKLSIRDVPVTPMNSADKFAFKGCDAILGAFVLTRIKLVIDYKDHVVYTTPILDSQRRYDYNRLGAITSYDNARDDFPLHVMKGSPADEAGIRDGDLLLKIDGSDRWQSDSDTDAVDYFTKPAGTRVKLLLKHGSETREVTVTLKELGVAAWEAPSK